MDRCVQFPCKFPGSKTPSTTPGMVLLADLKPKWCPNQVVLDQRSLQQNGLSVTGGCPKVLIVDRDPPLGRESLAVTPPNQGKADKLTRSFGWARLTAPTRQALYLSGGLHMPGDNHWWRLLTRRHSAGAWLWTQIVHQPQTIAISIIFSGTLCRSSS